MRVTVLEQAHIGAYGASHIMARLNDNEPEAS